MRAILAKYGYLLVWSFAIVLVGVVFWSIIQANSRFTPLPSASPPAALNPGPPPPPPAPSVTFTVQKSGKGNTLWVQWANLPSGTTGLDIFRSPKGKDQWSLWKHVGIAPGDLGSGSFTINIGSSLYLNYSFYITATGGGGGGGGNTGSAEILWTSSSTVVTVTTSTPNPPSSGSANTTSTPPQNQTSTSSSSTSNPPSSGSSTGGGTTPTGTPYYTPQLQISSYGTAQSGNFWVQHVDQKRIQLGWQGLPVNTTSIAILRSANQGGPWTMVLTQQNPPAGAGDSYSIQIADDTLGQPYYYEMQAFAESSTIATYGPVYLPPVGQ